MASQGVRDQLCWAPSTRASRMGAHKWYHNKALYEAFTG